MRKRSFCTGLWRLPMLYPAPLERLLAELEKLPGVGPKSAQRLAFYVLRASQDDNDALASAIASIRQQIKPCERCGHFTDATLCDICASPRRENGLLCIVSEGRDVLAIENSNEFYGRYHVLGGVISPLEGIGPANLRLSNLKSRVREENVEEAILALSPTVEGETTASFLASFLAETGIRVTQLARGLPFGGDLDYADQVTIAGALRGRREF